MLCCGNIYESFRTRGTVMKYKITAVLLILVFLLPLAVPAFAEEQAGDGETHECGGVVFDIPLSGELSGTLEDGSYYLTKNCRTKGRVKIFGEVNICLNGHVIETAGSTTLQVENGGTLNIYDCTGEGHIGSLNSTSESHPLTVNEGGTANLMSVVLKSDAGPMAVNNSGTVNVYDSKISCQGLKSDSIGIRNLGTVNFYGGEVTARIAVMMKSDGSKCVYHSGITRIDGQKTAFAYVGQKRQVIVEEGLEAGWKTEEEGEYRYGEFPSFEQLDMAKFIEVTFEPEPEEEELPEAEEPDAAETVEDNEAPDVTDIQENNAFETATKQETTADYSTTVYEPEEGKAAYIMFGVIAAIAASGAAILLIKLRKSK